MIADKYREKTAAIQKEPGKPDPAMLEAHYAAVNIAIAVCPQVADLIEAVEGWWKRGNGEWPEEEARIKRALTALREKMEELG